MEFLLEILVMTEKGHSCIFPFLYRSQWWSDCVPVGTEHNSAICGTMPNVDVEEERYDVKLCSFVQSIVLLLLT